MSTYDDRILYLRHHNLTFEPCASIASHSLNFNSARLTCVTLPNLESKAFQGRLVVSN